MVKKYIEAGIEVARFLKSLKSLVDKNFIKSIDQAKDFAKQEFGEVSDLMTLQINKIFKTKNQPVVGNKTKDPVFDNTVETIPFDDKGVPFNPRNPQKVYGKPKEKMETSDLDDILDNLEEDKYDIITTSTGPKEFKKIDNLEKSMNDIKEGVEDIMSDTSPAALKKSIEVDNLMLEYPGLSRAFAKDIATELNPRKKADMISMVQQTIKMSEEGKSGSEIIDMFKKGTDRTEQSKGGRIGYKDGTENMMAEIDYSSSAYRMQLIDSLMDTGGLDYGSAVKEADRIIEIKLRPKTKKKLAAGGLPNILGF